MPANGKKDTMTNQEKYEFIEEQIVPRRKNKVKKLMFSVGTTVALAIIFGFVSRAVFCLSGSCLENVFGENDDKKIITFTTPTPEPTASPQGNSQNSESEKDVKVIQNTIEATLKDYAKMNLLVTEIAKEFNQSVVTVSSVISGVDWFDNPSEQSDASYGVVIANNGEDLLILASKNKIEDSSSVRVKFSDNQTINASLYGYDKNTGIAIVAVPIADIPQTTLDSVKVAVLGDSYYLSMGTPVLGLGSPNGYVYSMELGMVTNGMMETYVTDSKLELFNTDLANNSNGEGVIVSLSGQVIGIITHNFSTGNNANINTALGITKVKSIIEQLVNHTDRVYFGIVGNDITSEYAQKKGIASGVYVTEVVADSPAFKAGIKNGDIITSISGNDIPSMSTFSTVLSTHEPKDILNVGLLRTTKGKSKVMAISVTLAKKN